MGIYKSHLESLSRCRALTKASVSPRIEDLHSAMPILTWNLVRPSRVRQNKDAPSRARWLLNAPGSKRSKNKTAERDSKGGETRHGKTARTAKRSAETTVPYRPARKRPAWVRLETGTRARRARSGGQLVACGVMPGGICRPALWRQKMTDESHVIPAYQCPECHKYFGSAGELQVHEHRCMSRRADAPCSAVPPVSGEKSCHHG